MRALDRSACWVGLGLACLVLAACGAARPRAGSDPASRPPAVVREAPPPPPLPSPPDAEEMTMQGYVKLDFPEPGLRGTPARFTWFRFPEAVLYTLILLDAEGRPLREWTGLADNWLDPPPGWAGELPGPGVYFWQVLAMNEVAEPIAKSSLRDFVYEP